tara:strand:+ start:379 stop:1188 length:810 start_codon:yes stop_codon:yes gene_type:complete
MKTLLLLDFNNLLYRGYFALPKMEFAGKSTHGLLGFMQQLCNLIKEFQTNHIIACLDAPPYTRKKLYPEYKGDRKDRDKDMLNEIFENVEYTIKLLEVLDIKYWKHQGLEADDLIANCCQQYINHYNRIVIVSSDDDLYQLLSNKVFIYKNKKLLNMNWFLEQYSLYPRKWAKIKAITGSHNNVEGIHKVGIKTAIKLVNDSERYNQLTAEQQELIKNNLKIIKLPLEYLATPFRMVTFKFNERKLLQFLPHYGIELQPWMRNELERYR